MKIGILTFHWATNYGAVLQCYALQAYLEQLGHNVRVIDYKPLKYDESLYNFIRCKKYLHLKAYIENRKKESSLAMFRNKKLKQTKRLYSYTEISKFLKGFDAVISGSDQVLNPFFLLHGEEHNIVCPAYFLGFQFKGKKIGYALSFGCVSYPQKELVIASKYINGFDSISVREKTGVEIVASMGRKDTLILPDPTLLMGHGFYHKLADEFVLKYSKPYIYSFFIRHISERKLTINAQLSNYDVLWNNEDGDYTMQGWLCKIKHADFVITDSFHCMVMCLKLHKPFTIITEKKGNVGMNDRLYTLLEPLDLINLILHKDDIQKIPSLMKYNFNWEHIDKVLYSIKLKGEEFLKCI